MGHRSVTEVRTDHNPFQLWIIGGCAASGVLGLLPLKTERTGAVDRYLPEIAWLWYVGILLGGIICLAAALIPTTHHVFERTSLRLTIERIGMTFLSGIFAGYGGALVINATQLPSGVIFIGLAVACVVRVRQIGRELAGLYVVLCQLRDQKKSA